MALETSIARPDLATPRRLYLTGYWDAALELLPAVVSPGAMDAVEPVDDPPALALAAEILVDRRWWRLDQADAAEAAVGRLQASGADTALAWLLRGQLAYTRVLFGLEPGHGDTAAAEESFALAGEDPRLAGWATMWLGAMTDNLRRDPARAAVHYADAFRFARDHDDPLLESYAVRHQARTPTPWPATMPWASRCCAAPCTCARRSGPGPTWSRPRPPWPTCSVRGRRRTCSARPPSAPPASWASAGW
jgi:hypothetical protein